MNKTFFALDEARKYHHDIGGWLLQTAHLSVNLHMQHGNEYIVTDDSGMVKDLRSADFISECAKAECWDETLLEMEKDDG
tara:strand:- start:152 stop:391 length:240 start_codon:yes stop_codon:yes gene_type:complete